MSEVDNRLMCERCHLVVNAALFRALEAELHDEEQARL